MEAFVAIARTGSITRAAEQIGVTKSAVSRRLSDLEARLGSQLLIRTTRHSHLTEAGVTFLENAERALDGITQAEASIRETTDELSGTIRVAAPVSFGLARLQPIFSQFMIDNPKVNLHIDFADRYTDLVEDGMDLAIRIGKLSDSSLRVRSLGPVEHTAASSPDFWSDNGLPKVPEELIDLPYLRYANAGPTDGLWFKNPHGRSKSIKCPIRATASNGDFLANLASKGLGFVVMPTFVLEPYLEDKRLQAVLTDTTWSEAGLHILYPPNRRITRRASALSEMLVSGLNNSQN